MTADEVRQARANLRWAVDAGELTESDYERRLRELDEAGRA